MVTFISDQPDTIITSNGVCEQCGAEATKTHNNDPLQDREEQKCNQCGHVQTAYEI